MAKSEVERARGRILSKLLLIKDDLKTTKRYEDKLGEENSKALGEIRQKVQSLTKKMIKEREDGR